MLFSPSLALVIPTLQEAATIARAVREITLVLDSIGVSYELIIVDDGSDDGTIEIVQGLRTSFSRLNLVQRVGERGLSGAVLAGWASTCAGVVGVIDADLQHPPDVLIQLWKAMQAGNDLAIASRYLFGAEKGEWPWTRRMFSFIALCCCRPLLAESSVMDPLSGCFLIRGGIARSLPSLQRSGFKLLLEILVECPSLKIKETPFVFGSRVKGKSKATLVVLQSYARLLIRLYWVRLGRRVIGKRADEK